MASTSLEEAYDLIDKFLHKLHDYGGDSVINIGTRYQTSTSIAFDALFDEGLISSRKAYKDNTGIVDITPKGIRVLETGGYRAYLSNIALSEKQETDKKEIELMGTKVNLELNIKILKDFPITKKRATIAFYIAIALAAIELGKIFVEILDN